MDAVRRYLTAPWNDSTPSNRTDQGERRHSVSYQRYKDLKDRLQGCEDDIEKRRRTELSLRGELESKEQEILVLKSAQETSEQRRRNAEESARGWKGRALEVEQELKLINAARAELEKALSASHVERKDLKTLLDTRTAELKEAQTYLSKVDDVSDSEVLRLVERINSLIFQTAAKIADDSQPYYGTQEDKAVVKQAASYLEKSAGPFIGPDLPRALRTLDHSDDPILVQIALQTTLTMFFHHVASPWSSSLQEQTDFLHSIYAEMCKREPQSVFGKWRTMTLSYVGALALEKHGASTAALQLVEYVSHVLLACGVDGTLEETHDSVKQHYGKQLKEIATHALEFRRIVGEQIVSRDLEVIVPQLPGVFHSDWMEDEWADAKSRRTDARSAEQVLCATSLGLMKREQKAEGASEANGGAPMNSVLLLKPKVVLQSTLRKLLAESESGSTNDDAHPTEAVFLTIQNTKS